MNAKQAMEQGKKVLAGWELCCKERDALKAQLADREALRKAAEGVVKSKMSAVPSGVFVGVEEFDALRAALLAGPGAKEEKT